MASILVKRLNRTINYLEQPELTRFLIMFIARALSLSFYMRSYDRPIYGHQEINEDDIKSESLALETFFMDPDGGQDNDDDDPHCNKLQASATSQNFRNKVMAIFKFVDLFRSFTTIWMVYIAIKFCFLDVHPANCYLAGRLVAYDPLSNIVEILMVYGHLGWRFVQFIEHDTQLDLVSFLLLSEREREAVISNLSQRSTLQIAMGDFDRLKPRFRQLLEIMCFRVPHETKFICKLRPTRSHSARLDLSRRLAKAACLICCLFTTVSSTCLLMSAAHIFRDENYIAMYPGCDPELEQAFRSQSYGASLNRFKPHRIYALIMTPVESMVMYLEGGVVYLAMLSLIMLSTDLIGIWSNIDGRMRQLQNILSYECGRQAVTFGRRTLIGRLRRHERDLDELLAAVNDFFQMVADADKMVAKFVVGMMIGMLFVGAAFSYYIHVWVVRQVPTSVALIAALIMLWFVSASFGFITVHARCESSYTRFCSLIAHDSTKHRRKYTAVLECYEKRRSCFTLMKDVPFLPTTFLTMFGWTFSCFCVITGLLRNSGRISQARASTRASWEANNGTGDY